MHFIRSYLSLLTLGLLIFSFRGSTQTPKPGPADPNSASRGLEHAPVAAASKPELSGKTYALLIGVSRYKNDPPITSLQYAHDDAVTFAELLKTPIGGLLKEPDEIRLLTEEKATRAAIDDAVRELRAAHGNPQNTLILFVGAHGVYLTEEEDPVTHRKIEKDPYILLYDTNAQDAKTTGYPMEEFRRMVAEQALTFGRVLVFLDVCHAANVAGIAGGSAVQSAVKRAWEGQAGELGLMMASHAGESAIESSSFGGGHGAFTYFVLKGLSGPAAAGETFITFADLAEYVRTNVRQFTRKAQDPYDQAPNTDMVLVPDIRKEGLKLKEASRLTDQDLRDIRRRRGASLSGNATLAERGPAREAFQIAIDRGLLLPEQPDSASNLLASYRVDPNRSPELLRERERSLHTALADRGQEVMSRYLEGDEVPQTKADFDQCNRYFEEALKLPQATEFDRSRELFCQGRAQIFSGGYDDAQRLLEESIRIDSRRAYSYNALGIAYLERTARAGTGFEQAEAAFRNAMRYAPYWAYPLHNLALLYSERGDYDRAIALYQYAISMAPRYSYLPYNLGLLYERLGDFENALLWFRKALEVLESKTPGHRNAWPERARIRNALGTIAKEQGHHARALELFKEAISDDPEDKNARHNAALILAKQSQYQEADDLWTNNLKRDPAFIPSRIAYANSLSQRGNTTAAINQYEQLVAAKPDYAGARESLARLYLANNNLNSALAQLNAALAQSHAQPALLELRGDTEMRLGLTSDAVSDWKNAASTQTDRSAKARLKRKVRQSTEIQPTAAGEAKPR